MLDTEFWKNKTVLLTGHTGFKGAWTALLLTKLGAKVTGIALAPSSDPALYSLLAPYPNLTSHLLDIRHQQQFEKTIQSVKPEIVIHMAAQALVRESYHSPTATFATNVMGTLYLLEALRKLSTAEIALIVTSDKVYRNQQDQAFVEQDCLGGDDPYSASKACVEIAVNAWRKSFFTNKDFPIIATARAGNVIGGGDFSPDRLIPDAVRAYQQQQVLELRYPDAVRPWQYVLDVVTGYLLYIQKLHSEPTSTPLAINFGPQSNEKITVSELLELFQPLLGKVFGWKLINTDLPEKKILNLNSRAAHKFLKWQNQLSIRSSITTTAAWYRAYLNGDNMPEFTNKQLEDYWGQA